MNTICDKLFLESSAMVASVMASATAVMAATVMMAFDVVVPFDVAVPLDALAPTAVVTTAAPAGAPAPAPAGPPRHDVGRLVRVGGAVVERGLRIVVIRFAVERGAGVALPRSESRADGQPKNDNHEE